MFTWLNPPHHLMGEESERNVPFALTLGKMLPHIEIQTLDVKKVSNETYTINLVIDNDGFFPTYTSNQGKKRGVMREVRVELKAPENVQFLNGQPKENLGHLEGRSNRLGQTFLQASPTDNRTRVEWTVKAPAGSMFQLSITSERAGSIHKEIILD
jgi:hypothetical protein